VADVPQRISRAMVVDRHGMDRHVTSYDGNSWTAPIYLAHSDNLLDNRPAVVAVKPGELVEVGSSDGRGNFLPAVEDKTALESVIKKYFGPQGPRARPLGYGYMMAIRRGKIPTTTTSLQRLYLSVQRLGRWP